MPQETDKVRRVTALKGIGFIAVIAAGATGAALFALSQRSEASAIVATGEPSPIPVRVTAALPSESLAMTERFTGIAEARRSSALGFERGGRIVSITADVGDRVTAGQVLARLDTRALEAELAAMRAQIDEASAAEALALSTSNRATTLSAQGLTPTQRAEEAQAGLRQATARIAALRASADALDIQISLSRITAPYSGTITARLSDEGAIAGPGIPILQLVEDDVVEIRFGLPADMAANLSVGDLVTLEAASGPFEARVKASTGMVDPARRTVELVFEATSGAPVMSGEIVRLSRDSDVAERGFWVPVSALAESGRGLWSLYIVETGPDGRQTAQPRLVEIVHAEAARAFVRGAIEPGEPVITEGLHRLTPGMRVSPVTE